ncbi:hypothetical protein [Poseidonibacter lekithochrous]|uniref:hypothetical protein n=1 Tax=Poseidonibacter lekithochrous TaxID=1904463 RepID=UPI0008FC4454|nr:hypothetical protein [Poseidonibacter lekithochrous]QKJ24200.1 hypothetical protein ALEK_2988 [Poseidonibacter lekithochrous]
MNTDIHTIIIKIIHLIRVEKDYSNAAKLLIENNLSFEYLRTKTYKLTQREIAILADNILLNI